MVFYTTFQEQTVLFKDANKALVITYSYSPTMTDITWLSAEAKQIHAFFTTIFYALITTMILIGVLVEYFKLPIGGMPNFASLVGRAFVATILLIAYPDISNTIVSFGDAMASQIGNLNTFDNVLSRAGETLKNHSWSWTSIGDTFIWILTYLCYFILYATVFFFDAGVVYCVVLLYVFSPILIALFTLPVTASATAGLFRTLFEVTSWKVVWAILSTLLWSSALENFNRPDTVNNHITQIVIMLYLAFSIVLTPFIVRSLLKAGLSSATDKVATLGAIAMSAGVLTPAGFGKLAAGASKKALSAPGRGARGLSRKFLNSKKSTDNGPPPKPAATKSAAPKMPTWVKEMNKSISPPTSPPASMNKQLEREKSWAKNKTASKQLPLKPQK